MHIMFIHQYFKTPPEGGAIRSWYLAKGLAERGIKVTMITSHNLDYYIYKEVEGIKVHYLPVAYRQEFNMGKRSAAFLKFVFKAILFSRKIEAINQAYVSSTPLTVGLIGLYLKWKRKIPYFFEVRDLWPEVPVQMGILKGKILKTIFYGLEKLIYRQAKGVVYLAPPVKDYIKNLDSQISAYYFPNMADCSFFQLGKKWYSTPTGKVEDTEFVISYIGAVGKANGLDYLLMLAGYCQQKFPQLKFLIVGEGSEKTKLQGIASEMALKNLAFLPFQNKWGVKKILDVSDAAMISCADYEILNLSSPNKLFDALAAGKLCITNTGGWIRNMLENNEAGIYYRNFEDFARQIQEFLNNPELLNKYQKNARWLAEHCFDKDTIVKKWVEMIIQNH